MTIKNGDMPAMPQAVTHGPDGGIIASYDFHGGSGLTKREQFAMAALQGILASEYFSDFCNLSELADKRGAAAEVAVKHADALLAELEKPND